MSLLDRQRREMMQVGAIGSMGLALPHLLQADESPQPRIGRAKACLLCFMEGGAATQDLWGLKPAAPLEYRGEFTPIASTLPGVPVCNHLPLLAQQMRHVTLVNSVHHTIVDHNASSYYMLTGRTPVAGGRLIIRDEPENFPPFGAVLAKHRPHGRVPEFVHLPDIMSNNNDDIPGQRAGFLGAAYDPFVTGDPSDPKYQLPGLTFPRQSSRGRLHQRRTRP